MIPTGVRVRPGVGSFRSSSLSLGDFPVVGGTHNVSVSFVPEMRLVPGDTITLFLSAFTGATGERRVFGESGSTFSASWIFGQELLIMTVTSAIEAGDGVAFSVALGLPLKGVARNTQTVRITATAASGNVLAEPLTAVAGVGRATAFTLDLTPRLPGAPVLVALALSYSHTLSKGDNLTLVLAGLLRDSEVVVAGAAVGVFAVEHWETQYHEVTLQCVSAAGCGTTVALAIQGLRLPLAALPANNPAFVVSAAVATAPMPVPVSVSTSPAVGLVASTLAFLPDADRVGVPLGIAVAFSPTMAVPAGEVFWLALPGFAGESGRVPISGRSAAKFDEEGTWNASTGVLNLTVTAALGAGELVEVGVANEGGGLGLVVPEEGVVENDTRFTVAFWTYGHESVLALPIASVEALGALRRSVVEFLPRDIPGSPALINVELQFTKALANNSRVVIVLPGGFTTKRALGTALTHVSSAAGVRSAVWLPDIAQLVLEVRYEQGAAVVAAMQNVSVTVWDMLLPARNATANETLPHFLAGFSRISIAILDETQFRPILLSAGLDLYNTTVLNSHNVTAPDSSATARRLLSSAAAPSPAMPATPAPATGARAPAAAAAGGAGGGSEGTALPRAKAAAPVPQHARVQAFLDTALRSAKRNSASARGASGVRAGGGADGVEGGVEEGSGAKEEEEHVAVAHATTGRRREQVACSSAVSNSRITYSPPAVGAEVEITIGFELHDLDMTEVKMHLPQLTRAGFANPSAQVTFEDSEFKVGFWEEDEKRLTAIAWQPLTSSTQSLTIPVAQGLALSPEGAEWNMTNVSFLFLLDGVDGYGCAVPFDLSQGVGSFSFLSLFFFPGIPDDVQSVNLQFAATMALRAGETVTLSLPGFSGASTSGVSVNGSCTSDPAGAAEREIAAAAWDVAADSLVLTVTRAGGIAAGDTCSMRVSAAAGVRLPLTGVLPDLDAQIGIAASAAAGSVVPGLTLVSKVRAVGSLLSHFMHYIPDADSVEVQIAVGFEAAMQLVPGDVLVITLPGFTGESTECVRIAEDQSSPRGSITLASWTSATNQLTLSVRRSIAGSTNITVNVPAATGIILPQEGVLPNEATLLIEVEALNGNAAPVPVQISDAVS